PQTITTVTVSAQTVTVNTQNPNGFTTGQTVLITGAPAGDNGAFVITTVTGTQFTYTVPNGTTPTAGSGGSAILFTPVAHSFHTNDQVQLSGITDINGNPVYNGVATVTGTPTASTFTFSAASGLANGFGGAADGFTGLPISVDVPAGFGSNVNSVAFTLT